MTWGRSRDHYEKLLRMGRPVPPEYINEKLIHPENYPFYELFWELGSERQLGMSAGQIPGSAIKAYATENNLTTDQTDFIRWIVRGLDNVFLSLHADKHPDEKVVDSASVHDPKGVSAILKRVAKKPKAEGSEANG
jgi:hypothetical protein